MSAQRIDIGKGQWIILRDGIAFFRGLNPRRPAEVSAAPEGRVRVEYRANPPSIWTIDLEAIGYVKVLALTAFAFLYWALILLDSTRAIIFGLTMGFGSLFVLCMLGIWRVCSLERAGWRSVKLTAEMGFRMLELTFNRVRGANPALETLLDCWREQRSVDKYGVPIAIAVSFRRRFDTSFGTALSVLTFLSLGIVEFYVDQGSIGFATACLLVAVLMLTPNLLTLIFNVLTPRALRAVRSALQADELEAARLMLEHFLASKPRHVYGNLLMAAYALMEGDIQLAARHRLAMRGENGRFRLAESLYTLNQRVSSARAFQSLAEYAAKGEFDTASPDADVVTTHEQPAH
ncbi:MAG: hypothetical protein IT365_17280 [Candidatus Hydrogenedentes bacterium]|nr:hypothetical protein [Candidatus Hydrogenedentota bacterium]